MLGKINREKIQKTIKKIITKKFKIEGELSNENIIEKYGITSIGIYETFIMFEKKFKIALDQNSVKISNFDSIEKMVEIIYGKIKK